MRDDALIGLQLANFRIERLIGRGGMAQVYYGRDVVLERPVAIKGEVVVKPMMYVALSYDHRIVDGREAVQFLVHVKELIEDPETLLLEG